MKRFKATILRYNLSDVVEFDAMVQESKTAFEDSEEYKTAKKDLENAQKAYDQSLMDDKMDEKVYLGSLELAQREFKLINQDAPQKIGEDSGVICPQLGERVLFIDNYHEVDLLDKEVIKLAKPFYLDTGSEYITITKDNFKEYDKADILKEKTDKYLETIN